MTTEHARSAHGAAGRAALKNAGAYTVLTIGQLLIRLVALSPLIYAIATRSFFGVPRAHRTAVALLASLPLWILLVLPCRYRLGGIVSRWLGHEGPNPDFSSYGTWLSQGIGRLLKALPWMVPLIAWLGGFYYYMNFAPFNAMGLMIDDVGKLIGGDYIHGAVMLALALVIAAVLAWIGWRRMMPFFYLPIAPLHEDAQRRSGVRTVSSVSDVPTIPTTASTTVVEASQRRGFSFLGFVLALLATFGALYFFLATINLLGIVQIFDLGETGKYALIISIVALLVCVVLAYVGWRLILTSRAKVKVTSHSNFATVNNSSVRTWVSTTAWQVTLINFLIILPPLAIALGVLGASVQSRLTGDIQMDMMVLLPAVTQFDFPQADLVRVGLVLLVTYLPFVIWRKTALAAAIHSTAKH